MFQLNKKTILIILVVLIVVVAGVAGALMYKPQKATVTEKKGVEKDRVLPPFTGWLASTGTNPSITIGADTNGTEIVSVSVNITIMDDDGAHSETDQGSDPDSVSVRIGNDTFEMETDPTTGMISTMKEYSGDKVGSNISVVITGLVFGGNKHPTGPIGRPIRLLVYVDQGVGYNVEIKYTYMDYNAGQPPTTDEEKK